MSRMSFGSVVLSVVAMASVASADERKFTYSYESKTLPQGTWEFEQWATLKTRKESGHVQFWQFREEIEYGLLDRLTTALYLNWEYEAVRGISGVENEHEVEFETVSSEWKYKLLDAVADPVGLLLYAEVGVGSEEQELELKLIVDKQIGALRFAYNFIVEFEREEEEEPSGEKEWEKESVLMHTFGVSYQANPNFAVGAEAFFHQEFEGTFKEQEHLAFFIGPNIHVSLPGWWATLTALRQVDRGSDSELVLDEHEKYEVRLIVGVNF
jgi:hypothetical protein